MDLRHKQAQEQSCIEKLGFKQRAWLAKLKNISPNPIYVQLKDGEGKPAYFSGWISLDNFKWDNFHLIDWRTVLASELVFEIDLERWGEVCLYARKLWYRLKVDGIPFVYGPSGGKGIHFHLFIDAHGVEQITGWRSLRVALWNYILDKMSIPEYLRQVGHGYCPSVVTFSDTSHGHFIREWGSTKRTVKSYSDGPPGSETNPKVVPTGFRVWHVPNKVLWDLEFPVPLKFRGCDNCDIMPPAKYPIWGNPEGFGNGWVGCQVCRRG